MLCSLNNVQVTLDAYCVSWRRLHSDGEEKLLVDFFYLVDLFTWWIFLPGGFFLPGGCVTALGKSRAPRPIPDYKFKFVLTTMGATIFHESIVFSKHWLPAGDLVASLQGLGIFLSKPKSLKDQILNAPTPERGKGSAPAAMCRDRILQSAMFNLWYLFHV